MCLPYPTHIGDPYCPRLFLWKWANGMRSCVDFLAKPGNIPLITLHSASRQRMSGACCCYIFKKRSNLFCVSRMTSCLYDSIYSDQVQIVNDANRSMLVNMFVTQSGSLYLQLNTNDKQVITQPVALAPLHSNHHYF